MNWDAIGAIGEIVGALAVLATLIYLAIQVRQNSEQVRQNSDLRRAQTHQQLADERGRWGRMAMENKEFATALDKAYNGQPLTLDEQRILFWFTVSQLRAYDNELYQHSKGMIEDDELALQRKLVDSPVMQIEAVEALNLHTFTPRTQQLIRELSEKRKAAKK